jgi:hypothetical protein
MRVTLESTSKVVMLNGEACRVWEGKTDSGIPCHAFIVRICVDREADASDFERDLKECRPASPEIEAIPARLVL